MKRVLSVALWLTACSATPFGPSDPFWEITPPAVYHTWWQEVETCVGQRRDMEHVTWFLVAADSFLTPKGWKVGYWRGGKHEIYITESEKWSEWHTVKHEILHEIRHNGEHPSPPFGVCADVP